jgi:hypothetical protein
MQASPAKRSGVATDGRFRHETSQTDPYGAVSEGQGFDVRGTVAAIGWAGLPEALSSGAAIDTGIPRQGGTASVTSASSYQ